MNPRLAPTGNLSSACRPELALKLPRIEFCCGGNAA